MSGPAVTGVDYLRSACFAAGLVDCGMTGCIHIYIYMCVCICVCACAFGCDCVCSL